MTASFEGLAADTSRGYEDILRAAMAYSALEILQKGITQYSSDSGAGSSLSGFHSIAVVSTQLAQDYREPGCDRLRSGLQDHLYDASLKTELADLAQSGDNVTGLAKALRHLAFHGVFSPGTIRYSPRGSRAVVQRVLGGLHQETLRAVNEHFTSWVEAVMATPGPTS